ncbi:MAG: MFS transporter [Anaerolineales bacterium]|nr:MFS transporter [Anaerolineales bacterium]
MAQGNIQAELEKHFKHNFRVNVLDGAAFWFGASFFATRTIAPLFLSYLTDNTFAFGLLAMIASTGWSLPQLFTANWVQRLPIKKVVPVVYGFWWERLPVLLLPLAAWAALKSSSLAIILFLFLIAWHVFGAGIVAVGWQDMIAKIFPVAWRGRYFGVANFLGNGTGILGASAAAWILGTMEFPYSFMLVFGIAGIFIFISWVFLRMTREPAREPNGEPQDYKTYWRSIPVIIRADQNFRHFLISGILGATGFMAVGFLTVYAIRTWNVSGAIVSLYTTSMLAGNTLANPLLGWLGDKFGHKKVIVINGSLAVAAIALALFASSPEWFYLVFALLGANQAGFLVSGITIVFEFSEEDVRPTYIGINNTVMGIVGAIAPLFASLLIEQLNFQVLFWVSIAFSLASIIYLIVMVKEPRKAAVI